MNPWILHDTAAVPGGGQLRLLQRGDDFFINLGAEALMTSRMRGSEEALARLAFECVAGVVAPKVLIGGLGMGFTLRAALPLLDDQGSIVVAELVPAVVSWARGVLAPLHGASLDDPRVTVTIGDVGRAIRAAPATYHAILLDVDNGPDGLTRAGNDALYGKQGLAAAWTALRPGGVLAVWSAAPDPAFTARLRSAGFTVDEIKVPAQGTRGTRHVIWLAERSMNERRGTSGGPSQTGASHAGRPPKRQR